MQKPSSTGSKRSDVNFFPVRSKHQSNGQVFSRALNFREVTTRRTTLAEGVRRIRASVPATLLHGKVKEAKQGRVCRSNPAKNSNRMGSRVPSFVNFERGSERIKTSHSSGSDNIMFCMYAGWRPLRCAVSRRLAAMPNV
mmetsp:Transcript_11566/g.71164  ORF Transcript_11566/g.71164 Transcript_11566/m.71164 type:complete len:140 (+) Transcript_11566:652-1071(+)